jgi:uncharacterized protein
LTAEPPDTSSITQDERTMAILVHVLQLVGWWIAPLIIFLIRRQSRFVSFHALQALLLQIVNMVLWFGCMILWMTVIFSSVILHPPAKDAPPPAIFILFPLIWLVFMGLWAVAITLAIVFALKAGRGEWADYPLLGPLARRILKLAPDGTPLSASA